MAKEQADEHLVKQCKALAKENEHLKDSVMFLEKLNEILKQRSGPVKKEFFIVIGLCIGQGGRINVRRLCAIVGVSRCGFYKYYGSHPSTRALEDNAIAEAVDGIQDYGTCSSALLGLHSSHSGRILLDGDHVVGNELVFLASMGNPVLGAEFYNSHSGSPAKLFR
jgi:hypothetical protein